MAGLRMVGWSAPRPRRFRPHRPGCAGRSCRSSARRRHSGRFVRPVPQVAKLPVDEHRLSLWSTVYLLGWRSAKQKPPHGGSACRRLGPRSGRASWSGTRPSTKHPPHDRATMVRAGGPGCRWRTAASRRAAADAPDGCRSWESGHDMMPSLSMRVALRSTMATSPSGSVGAMVSPEDSDDGGA